MARRSRVSRRRSRRIFRNTAIRTHKRNVSRRLPRGGYSM